MTDYTKLAELAKAANQVRGHWYTKLRLSNIFGNTKDAEYVEAASPDVMLALIADNTRLAAENELAQSNLGKYMAAATELQAQLDAAVALTADLAGKLGALQSQEPFPNTWKAIAEDLQAQLDALKAQKPVGHVSSVESNSPLMCGLDEWTRKGLVPLFAAAGAQPALKQIGTIGHIGTGKTTLTAALSSVLAAPAQPAAQPVAPGWKLVPTQEFESCKAKTLANAYAEGWRNCADAEFVGEEAQNDAFNNSTTLHHCIVADQLHAKEKAAPAQPVAQPVNQELLEALEPIESQADNECADSYRDGWNACVRKVRAAIAKAEPLNVDATLPGGKG